MLGFFRRIINSKAGIVVTFIVLGVIALAFAAGDVTGLRTNGAGGMTADDVAKVGKTTLTAAELRARVQNEMETFRQQQPTLDMATFVTQGGLDGTLERSVTSLALDQFGADQGMVVSRRAVDGQIASIPGLQGPTGKFSPQIYQQLLQQRHLTDMQIRSDIARDTLAQQLIQPNMGATQVPQQLALPYASLLLEKRAGSIGFVPAAAMAKGAMPTDGEIAAFYQRNAARYTVPQRRVIRYAVITADAMKARATPTDAEIAAAYKAQAARFAPAEKRTIVQVVTIDQAGANAIAAKVKAGTPIADAARAAGLEASTQTDVTKPAYAGTTATAVADAVFAAAKGAVVGPIRGALGWTVARVEAVRQDPGKTLAQAHDALATELGKTKTLQALSAIHDSIDDSLGKNATFDEVIADQKLSPQTTPGVLQTGVDPDHPEAKPDPTLAQVYAAGYAARDGDAPQLVQTGADGSFAVVALGRIVPAAPRPLAQVKAQVAADIQADRARIAARKVAGTVLASVNKGTPLQAALAQSGTALPPSRPIAASRAQLAANPQGVPPPLALMFSMAKRSAKLLEAPNGAGWYVIKLDTIVPGDAAGNQAMLLATRSDLARGVGREYVEQFAKAVRAQVGVKIDAAAVARVRAGLLGQGGSAAN